MASGTNYIEKFQSFDLLDAIVLVSDNTGEIVFANKAVENVLGIKAKDVLGNGWWEKVKNYNTNLSKEDRKKETSFFASGKKISFEIELSKLKKSNGDFIWVQWSKTVTKDNYLIGVAQDVTEKVIAEEELKKNIENTKLLGEIGFQITSSRSVEDTINKVYESVNKLMDAAIFGIGILESKKLLFPKVIERGEHFGKLFYNLEDTTRPAIICIQQQKEIVINDYYNEISKYTKSHSTPVAGKQPQSLIYIPLISKGKVIGVITTQSFEKFAYEDYQVNLLKNLSLYVASAIENASLYETMEEQIKERTNQTILQKKELEINYNNTKLLSEIGQQLTSSLSFEDIFLTLHENINKVMNAEMFGVRIYHQNTNTIEYKYEVEDGIRQPVVSIPMDDDDNYSVWCIKNKREIFINDNRKEFTKYVKEIKVPMGQMPNSLLFYPMIVNDVVIGLVTVQCMEKNAYNDYHLDVLKTLASYTGSALHNATLYETLENKVKERTIDLAEKNKNIIDSINYAKRIQDVILTDKASINKILDNYFIFYQPKDIISGDFYLIDNIRTNNGLAFHSIVVGDCTGHGVPGGMLSMLCSSLLRQSFSRHEVNSPADSLEFVSNQLQSLFKRDSKKYRLTDGMDVAYAVLNKERNLMYYAGANNNAYIIRNDKLIEIKGNKQSVSYTDNRISFKHHEVAIEKGDLLYLTTDGFYDQFGGNDNKKYKKRRFKDLILKIHKKPLPIQYESIKQEFYNWKGENEQTDDVCFLGVKI